MTTLLAAIGAGAVVLVAGAFGYCKVVDRQLRRAELKALGG